MSLTSRIGPWFQQQWARLVETTTPTAEAGIGQIYTKADNALYFQDGAGVEHQIYPVSGITQYYGEGSCINERGALNVREAAAAHGVHIFPDAGDLNGWTFTDGEETQITAQADAGSGEVTMTAAGHGLAEGDVVTINDTTNYTGIYYVESVSGNDFNVTAAWAGNDASGYVQRSGTLTCGAGSDGDYRLTLSGNLSHDGNDDAFMFYILHNLTPITKLGFEARDANADAVWPISISGIIENVAEGDKIGFIHNGGSGVGMSISLSFINMSVVQIGS